MKLVYVAGPFRAKSEYIDGHQDMFAVQENVMAAMKLGLEVARTTGLFPVIPHANTMFFTAAAPDSVWLDGDMEMLARCDAILMMETWRKSSGARAEHDFAMQRNIPIFYHLADLREWVTQKAEAVA